MKPADAVRAAVLVQAFGELDELAEDLRNLALAAPGADDKAIAGLVLEAGCFDRAGAGSAINTILVDAVTAYIIVPLIRSAIRAELKLLGVEV